MSKIIRARIIVTGKVQGVYYRAATRQEARSHGINGWVINRPDGAVEAVFEGEMKKVEQLIDWCRQGPPHARVSSVQVEWEETVEGYRDFRIIS